MKIAADSRWRSTGTELRAGIAWSLVVLGLTLVILLLGAIVLPAQADEIPAEHKVRVERDNKFPQEKTAVTIAHFQEPFNE